MQNQDDRGVHVSMNGCLFLHVSPVIEWQPSTAYPASCLMLAGVGSIPAETLEG